MTKWLVLTDRITEKGDMECSIQANKTKVKNSAMKIITAIIREVQLDKVREALIAAEITRITVSRVSGHGQQRIEEMYRGQRIIPDLIPKIKIEIGVNDGFVDITIDAILRSARTTDGEEGNVGDGKIFITPLEECIRIRTGERGGSAI
jgi:nitrogen regulatory protein PII